MKKALIILLTAAILLSFAACGGAGRTDEGSSSVSESASPDTSAAPDTSVAPGSDSAEPVDGYFAVQTPYGAIFVPERYYGAITANVKNSDPSVLHFFDAEDGTGLFTILFGKETSIPVTTMYKNGTEIGVFAEFTELDKTAENYDRHLEYQEVLNDIISYFENGPASPDDAGDKDSVFSIETAFMTLKYPTKWQDRVTVDVTDTEASFSSSGVKLFDVCFGGPDGFRVGSLRGMPINIVTYDFDEASMTEKEYLELCEMQEDMNVLIDRLSENEDFAAE